MVSAPYGALGRYLLQLGLSMPRLAPFSALLASIVIYGIAPPALAKEWEVTPSLSISETYTDNVFLAPDESRTSDWVTQVVPGISISSTGPRLRVDAWYAPEISYYAHIDRDDKVFNRGNAVGTIELADELLFLEAGAGVDQYDISLRGPLTTSNVNITGNRATATTSYLTPYIERNLGSAARVEARYSYSVWRSDDPQQTLPDNDSHRGVLRIGSGPAYKLLTWESEYSGEAIKYVTGQETTTQVFTAGARRSVSSTLALLAQAGYESYDTGLAPTLEAPRWSIGFEWTPTPRTRLQATAGKRLEENSYGFEFRHRTRLTSWSATYAEAITTSRSLFVVPATTNTSGALDQIFLSQYPDPTERQRAVQEFIARAGLPPNLGAPVNFFTDELFLQKRWVATAGLLGTRNTLVANVFWERRRALQGDAIPAGAGDFAYSQSIQMAGGGLAWSLRLTERTTWNFDVGYTRNDFLDADQVDDYAYLRAGLTRQLGPRLFASLTYRKQVRDSTAVTTNYVENAGIASMKMSF